jgi:hypothetical protein
MIPQVGRVVKGADTAHTGSFQGLFLIGQVKGHIVVAIVLVIVVVLACPVFLLGTQPTQGIDGTFQWHLYAQ